MMIRACNYAQVFVNIINRDKLKISEFRVIGVGLVLKSKLIFQNVNLMAV